MRCQRVGRANRSGQGILTDGPSDDPASRRGDDVAEVLREPADQSLCDPGKLRRLWTSRRRSDDDLIGAQRRGHHHHCHDSPAIGDHHKSTQDRDSLFSQDGQSRQALQLRRDYTLVRLKLSRPNATK